MFNRLWYQTLHSCNVWVSLVWLSIRKLLEFLQPTNNT